MRDPAAVAVVANEFGKPIDMPAVVKGIERIHRQLVYHTTTFRRFNGRLKAMVTWKDRVSGNGCKPMGDVQWDDRPEIEMYFKHRDIALRLERSIEKATAKLDKAGDAGDDLHAAAQVLQSIDRLEAKLLARHKAMTDILESLSREGTAKEALMAKMTTDAANFVAMVKFTAEKIEIARKNIEDNPTPEELRDRLAKKYGLDPDQVEQFLKAKAVVADGGHVAP